MAGRFAKVSAAITQLPAVRLDSPNLLLSTSIHTDAQSLTIPSIAAPSSSPCTVSIFYTDFCSGRIWGLEEILTVNG